MATVTALIDYAWFVLANPILAWFWSGFLWIWFCAGMCAITREPPKPEPPEWVSDGNKQWRPSDDSGRVNE